MNKIDALASSSVILVMDNVTFADIMTDFIETNYNDWCQGIVAAEAAPEWYTRPEYYLGRDDFWFTIEVDENNDGSETEVKKFSRETLMNGWTKLCVEDTDCARRLVGEDYDADDVDRLMQYCVFGEVVFG
jgi:hypothetical protein